jgi:glucosamine-6-phosphate deaminase
MTAPLSAISRPTYAIKLLVVPNASASSNQMAEISARMIAGTLSEKSGSVMGTATGRTQIATYAQLIRLDALEVFRLDSVRGFFALDENLKKALAGTYFQYMHKNFYGPAGISEDDPRVHLPAWDTQTPEVEAIRYEGKIVGAGGADVQLLGIGPNGHIAFNEPGTPFESVTHVVNLSERTQIANSPDDMTAEEMRMLGLSGNQDPYLLLESGWDSAQRDLFFKVIMPRVVKQAITQGISTILSARRLILLANGDKKQDAVLRSLLEAPTLDIPASLLQYHPDVTFIVDESAAGRLPRPIRTRVGSMQWITPGR